MLRGDHLEQIFSRNARRVCLQIVNHRLINSFKSFSFDTAAGIEHRVERVNQRLQFGVHVKISEASLSASASDIGLLNIVQQCSN